MTPDTRCGPGLGKSECVVTLVMTQCLENIVWALSVP